MMDATINLDYVVGLAKQLSPLDKVRLIERIAPTITEELQEKSPLPRKSLRGLWEEIEVTPQDINELRLIW